MENNIAFPLEHPTHYLACISDDVTGDCTHVSVRLSAPTLSASPGCGLLLRL